MTRTFEPGFLWGGAVSNVQAEGAIHADGKGTNVYDVLQVVPEQGQQREDDADVASNHYRQFREDVALVKECGFKAYRFSIVWSRIHPKGLESEPNAAGLAFYDQLVDELIAAGIEPVASLVHFDMPQQLAETYNGFMSPVVIDAYVRHVEQLAEHFKGRVRWWITYNEINTAPFDAMSGLVAGARRPEGMSKPQFFHDIFYNTMLASARATIAIKRVIPDTHVSGMLALNLAHAARDTPEDRMAARLVNNFNVGLYADVFTCGSYPSFFVRWLEANDIDASKDDMTEIARAAGLSDYLPISCYTTCAVHCDTSLETVGDVNEVLFNTMLEPDAKLPTTAWGWAIDPVGFRDELSWLYQRAGERPLFVVENGIGLPEGESEAKTLADDERIAYHQAYLKEMLHAVQLDGVKVLGYLMWSPIDILSSHKEMRKRYGLIYIAPMEDGVMRRVPKKSFDWYRRVIASNGGVLDE